jgi:hypothetical protein
MTRAVGSQVMDFYLRCIKLAHRGHPTLALMLIVRTRPLIGLLFGFRFRDPISLGPFISRGKCPVCSILLTPMVKIAHSGFTHG